MIMRRAGLCSAAVVAWACAAWPAEVVPPDWSGAKWIWCVPKPGTPLASLPEGVCYFRAGVAVTERASIASADLLVTADNLCEVTVNGKPVGGNLSEPDAWNSPKRFDVAALLMAGDNVIAVEAANTVPGAAGLILKLRVILSDGQSVERVTDASWRCFAAEETNWRQPDFNDQAWFAAAEVAPFGAAPWGQLPVPAVAVPPSQKRDDAQAATVSGDYPWPQGIVFLGDDCSLSRSSAQGGTAYQSLDVTIFNPGDTRAFPEHDLPGPMKVGRKLYALAPAKPGVTPRLLLAAGRGAIGSPSVSIDGQWIFFSMACEGEAFYHLYRIAAAGGTPQRLTDGRFHDIDPVELPDGRIAFTSTRSGSFEEYHNTPSRALFTMRPDGREIRRLTSTFIFDNEPEVMADGRILFIRSDNVFDRGKVETLLHAIHPDGTDGYTEFGLDLGPGYGNRLRAFNCGSPAPMPDGRVAYLTGAGIAVGRPGCAQRDLVNLPLAAGDVAALPDGRLLCTSGSASAVSLKRKVQRAAATGGFRQIGIVDPGQREFKMVPVYVAEEDAVHSPVYLGPRERPPVLASRLDEKRTTGVLYCQNARLTRNTAAGWPHVRAIRVLAGRGLTLRSSHSYIVHAGNETVELGTVPLAPDGSFAVEVPADTAIAFQAVDAEGRSELNEMSWVFVRPGESRGCVGCHAVRQTTPSSARIVPLATLTPPLRLTDAGDPHRFRGNNAAVTGLTELQFDRFREVAGLNRISVPVSDLIVRLQKGEASVRAAAANRLALWRDPAAAPALAECLTDKIREVRVAAAFALAACGTRESVPFLVKTASDPDLLFRQTAFVALENLTGHAESGGWAAWFRTNSWEQIEASLVQRIAGNDRDEVRRAAVALGHTGGEAARAALRETLKRLRDDTAYVAWHKAHQGDDAKFTAQDPVNPRAVQEVARALGRLKDAAAVPLLAEALKRHADPDTGNLFLAEAAAEALGRIATPEAEAALIETFAGLKDYPAFTTWYGDHPALMACHASPVHLRIVEALDTLSSTNAVALVPHLIRCVPTDPDRALFLENDDCETLIGRVLRRQGAEARITETCLSVLGDSQAASDKEVEAALGRVHGAWAGTPDIKNRAAQILSLTCRDRQYVPRLLDAFARHAALTNDIPRVFDKGIPVVQKLPTRHWVCFYLGRTLGTLGDVRATDTLLAALASPNEFAGGSPDPLGPGILFLHNDLTPCWRAAAAWALGRIGDRRAAPALLKVVGDLGNASDTRHAAAVALDRMADPAFLNALRKVAADYPEFSTRTTLDETVQRLSRLKGVAR
ncbi:MAG: HEAT repeat domain-containing protein [bacterium]